MLCPELFKQLEAVRWNMDTRHPPGMPVRRRRCSAKTQAQTIKMNAITRVGRRCRPPRCSCATTRDDSDFSRLHERLVLRGAEAQPGADGVPAPLPPRSWCPPKRSCMRSASSSTRRRRWKRLMLHFCGEIRLNHWYRRAAEWHTEPVIRAIYETLARDEARHGGAYLRVHEARPWSSLATRRAPPSPRSAC